MRRAVAFAVFAAGLVAPAVSASSPATMTWRIGDATRSAVVYPPSAPTPPGGAPLVLAFHGHGGRAAGAARQMKIQELWPQAVVVYPQGLPTATKVDPAGLAPGWQRFPGEVADRDLAFVDAMLETLRKQYTIDPARIHATGFSNGAIFAYVLWARRADMFASFASVSGALWPPTRPTEPRPLLHIGGTRDRLVKMQTQEATVNAARAINGCPGDGKSCGPICTVYASPHRAPVVTWYHRGGHIYPPFATQVIVKFFQDHPQRAG